MSDHILESPENSVKLSYNIYMDGSTSECRRPEKQQSIGQNVSDIDIVSILTYYLSVGCYGGTSGTGYIHLKKQEWIYAKLASQIAALSNAEVEL